MCLLLPDLDFLFHMFFLARYCKLLEENSFRGRTADFFYMLLFGATVLTAIVLVGGMIPYLSESIAEVIFLSNSLTFMMVSSIWDESFSSFTFIQFIRTYKIFLYTGLCVEQAKPIHPYELFRPFYFYGSLPAMGE